MTKLKFKNVPVSVKVIYIFFFMLFAFFSVLYIYPLIWAFINSLKSMKEYATNSLAMPTSGGWLWRHYLDVFTEFQAVPLSGGAPYRYFDMLFNSLWILVVYVSVNVGSSSLLAYALARYRFPGSKFLYSVVIFANTIPIIGSGPAAFKLITSLGMIDNPATIWLSWASGFDFAFIVLYGYFKGISPSYSESAYIDGAGELRVFFSIILPQVVPCLVAIMITQAISVWNDYGTVMIYLRKTPNLAYGLYLFKATTNYIPDSDPIYFAATVISAIPVIILYACTQKLILTNMTAGGLKG